MKSVWSAPVRFVECDQQGVVFNAHYLTWCDETMTPLLDGLGTPYRQLLERGLDTRVVSSTLDWTASARYGDVVDVDATVDRVGNSSFTIEFGVRVGDTPCCTVRTTYVMVDDEGRPTRIPDDVRAAWS